MKDFYERLITLSVTVGDSDKDWHHWIAANNYTSRNTFYQYEYRTDDFPAETPVETRTKAKHLLNVFTELIQPCNYVSFIE